MQSRRLRRLRRKIITAQIASIGPGARLALAEVTRQAKRESVALDLAKVAPEFSDEALALVDEEHGRQVELSRRRPWLPPAWYDIARTVCRELASGGTLVSAAERVDRSAKMFVLRRTAEVLGLR